MEEQKQIRCAIYTRKSTDEGLEKEFNTLEAQREAGENFVMSMKHQGWVILPERYDDGGFSGGNLKRPALKRLMADVEKGIVDMIVVYKIDRLTRSLLDFAQLVQTFEKNNCSFVSVTQHFNTCDSMGKLTLNILLSFAQFERELGAERVRDKIAASKKKGMWTGGAIPLGYDVNNKKLVINPAEAETIRFIFEDYKRTRSQIRTVEDLNEKGFKPKTWKTKTGKIVGCEMFNHAMISNILNNPIYIGMVPYKGELYKGQHKAIITQELWDETRKVKKDNIGTAFRPCRSVKNSLLKGLLECSCCGTMTPTRSKRGNKYYEYYTSLKAVKEGANNAHCQIGSIPAGAIDNFVLDKVKKIFQTPELQEELLKEFKRQNEDFNGADVHNIVQDIGQAFQYFEPATVHEFITEVVEKVIVYTDHIIIKLRPMSADLFERGAIEKDSHYNEKLLELSYKKSEIADLIVALCEFNLYGCTSVKLTDMKKIHFDAIQEVIELRNSRWLKTCEINAQNAKKRTSNRKATAERNSSEPPAPAQSDRPEDKEKENDSELDEDKESESDFINKKDKDKEPENVDKSRYVGAPSVEEVAIYCKESGYTIDPVAFVKWNSERGWMNGKKYIALDWRKAVRKWFCKENGLFYSEMESMTDICHDMLSKVKGAQDEASHT